MWKTNIYIPMQIVMKHISAKKKYTRDRWKKKSESKLTRQKMSFPFLGISIKEELLFIKDFQYWKILKVHVLILNSSDW